MYAILGEDASDVELINVLIRRIAGKNNLTVKKKGYSGCAELLTKGAKAITAFKELGCSRFIICYDSDRSPAADRYKEIVDKIILKSGVAGDFCALVPVQEIESWILADLYAVTKLIPSWEVTKEQKSPENVDDPKEYLERLCRRPDHKPLYTHSIHNPKIAQFLCLKTVASKCPSSLPLFELVQKGAGNYPNIAIPSNALRVKAILADLELAGH